MRPSSAKAKGRALQQWVVDKLIELLGFDPEDLESRPMGSNGEDVIMGVLSRGQFPYSIECKNQEAVNVWKAYEQAESDANTEFNHKFVVELAVVADKKDQPKRLIVVLLSTIGAFIFIVFGLLIKERIEALRKDA